MNKLYTIGFTKKSAEEFFNLLKDNNVDWVIDIRLNPNSQLSGFAKGKDIKYFLKKLAGIEYKHIDELSPTKDILNEYRKKIISWEDYEKRFYDLLENRKISTRLDKLFPENAQNICLLCSEASPLKCHRRIVAEYIRKLKEDIKLKHIE